MTVRRLPWYDEGMTAMKRKLSLSLDDDLINELAGNAESISVQVNTAIRNEIDARRRHKALGTLLDRLSDEAGPLDTAEDEAEIVRYMRLIGGPV